jgi:hypothetical protein
LKVFRLLGSCAIIAIPLRQRELGAPWDSRKVSRRFFIGSVLFNSELLKAWPFPCVQQ